MDPTDRFIAALNARDLDALAECLHPDFEMVVPQKPNRGFRGRGQELANMRYLFETCPDMTVTLLRKCVDGTEIWTETTATGTNLNVAACVIWQIDPVTDTIRSGRYYAEAVQHDAPGIDDYMRSLPADHSAG